MSADEMFKELGYRKPKSRGAIEIWEKESEENTAVRLIVFETDKSIHIGEYFRDNGSYYMKTTDVTTIPIQELKAINKKCEELRVVRMTVNDLMKR